MNPTEVVAIIGGASTTAVAISGYVFNWLRGERDQRTARELAEAAHRHERALARNDRLHDELRVAYEEAARFIDWMAAFVERTHPVMTQGPTLPVPEPPTDEEVREIGSRVSIISSEEIMTALDAAMRAYLNFKIQGELIDELRATGGSDLIRARTDLQRFREEFRAADAALKRQMHTELRA